MARTVLLVGRERAKEVDLETLNPRTMTLLAALAKEWSEREQFKATIPVSDDMLSKLPQDQKVIGTRWVLTYKSGGVAKARLVVQGCQEHAAHIRGDAPTASRDAMLMVFVCGSQSGWMLGQYDAKCAYLRSEGLGRSLLLRMPSDLLPSRADSEW